MQNIKATFPAGVEAITVHGLHQWDYGRQLEISATGLPALVEVHFACPTMTEAVVRSCSVTNGVLTATIPDICLEQTAPVVAWVYEVGASAGSTILTVLLPVTERTRPQPNATIPTATSDKYTEAVAAMNTVVNNLASGSFTAARANADGNGNNIPNTYATKNEMRGDVLSTDIIAKAEELIAQGGWLWVKNFIIAADDYEKGEDGKPVNLPNPHSYAIIHNYYGNAFIFLYSRVQIQPHYYCSRISAGEWTEWHAIIDSRNIGKYKSKTAEYVQVTLDVVVENLLDQPAANCEVIYYQNGERKKESFASITAGTTQSATISADLGSYISFSDDYGSFAWDEDNIPLVPKHRNGAEGSYEYRARFIIIGGGEAFLSITGKG